MKPIKILLIEDNAGDILLTTEALEEGRIFNEIDVVKDGHEAILYLDQIGIYEAVTLPDLILLDINLPKKNGHEVLQHIKNSDKLKRIPVIMLTTSSAEVDVLNAYENHANCYIVKPIDVENFVKVVSGIENFWFSIVRLPDHQL